MQKFQQFFEKIKNEINNILVRYNTGSLFMCLFTGETFKIKASANLQLVNS